MTTGEVTARLSVLGADLLIPDAQRVGAGTVHPVVQDEKLVSWRRA